MQRSQAIKLVTAEIETPTLGVTEQILASHQIIY